MTSEERAKLTRRTFLQTVAPLLPATGVLAACGGQTLRDEAPDAPARAPASAQPPAPAEPAQARVVPPTPECGDEDDVTPPQTEGPFYTPDSPERRSLLEPGITGTHLVVTGHVLTTECKPVAGALVDFWHADDGGAYDNVGYRLRGHQFTDEAGRYTLETIVPGLYPGRTRHIHVKVQAPNQRILTTQLYFPGEPRNDRDRIFNRALLMDVQAAADGQAAAFDFVLEMA